MRSPTPGLLAAATLVAATIPQLLGPSIARAAGATINVPADKATIQAAIDAASDGDTVVVAPGTYHEHLTFGGKAIEVKSSGGAWQTTIDGDGTGTAVTFANGEGRGSVLRNLTVRNGSAELGGGISITDASPTIVGDTVTANHATRGGAGIWVTGFTSQPLIQDNQLTNNGPVAGAPAVDGAGGGLALQAGAADIEHNVFDTNTWPTGGALGVQGQGAVVRNNRFFRNTATATVGGAVLITGETNTLLMQNFFSQNTAAQAGGAIAANALGVSQPTIANNTITGNTAPKGSAIFAGPQETLKITNNTMTGAAGVTVVECQSPGFAALDHNDLYNTGPADSTTGNCGNVVGANANIGSDPRFASTGVATSLRPSGVIDSGVALFNLPATDIDGHPRVVDGNGDGVAAVDMGAWETSAANTGAPEAWGWNVLGELGNGTKTDAHSPAAVSGLTSVAQVAGGVYHSVALRNDGTVWAWGWNGVGQLGDGTTTDRSAPVQVPGLTGVIQVAVGAYHSLALKSDGTVWAWGWNPLGQLGDNTTTDRHSPVQVAGLTGVTAISAGAFHNLALKADGTVWSWGWNGFGQLGDGTKVDRHTPVKVAGLSGANAIAAGYYHNVVAQQGSILTWGYNAVGQLGTHDNVDRLVPTRVNGASDGIRVAAGAFHTIVLEGDGTVTAWGWNGAGQLGDGTTTDNNFFVFVGIGNVVDVAAGAFHSVALKSDGTVLAWGWNGAGQLGDGTTVDRHVPTVIPGAAGSVAIGAGAYHTLSS